MGTVKPPEPLHPVDVAAWVLTAGALVAAQLLHLWPALLAGLLVYEIVHLLAPRVRLRRVSAEASRLIAVALVAVVVIGGVSLGVLGLVAFFRSDAGSVSGLLQKMAETIERSRPLLPDWVLAELPDDAEALRQATVEWLREHAVEVQRIGAETGRVLAHVLIGMVIGGLVSLHEVQHTTTPRRLARALGQQATRLGDTFRRIVFAQVRISFLNTLLTAVYLGALLPTFGVGLPRVSAMVGITFVAGLVPIVGNLLSNSIIAVVSLGHSVGVAIASLVFLVVIHKLEYFVNARVVGTEIRARPWELLTAMLVMEAAFGLPGVVVAPIYYAYVKGELATRGLV